MNDSAATMPVHASPLLARLRAILAVIVTPLVFIYATRWLVFPYAFEQPMVIAASPSWLITMIGLPILILFSVTIGCTLSARRNVTRAVWLTSIALLLWVYPGGTMDEWLIAQRPVPGPPTGAAYVPLLLDYFVGLVIFGVVLHLGASFKDSGGFLRGIQWKRFTSTIPTGAMTLGVTTLGAILIMWPLMGAAVSISKRLQVFFAVIVAFALAAMLAKNLFDDQHVLWYWLAVPLVGLIGVVVAIMAPAMSLPLAYRQIDTLPAWWLVRPLPFEMLAGGWLGVIIGLGLEKPTEEQEQPSL